MIWESSTPPPHSQMSPFGWIIVLLRAIPIGLIVSLGLCLTLVLRLLEYPLFGQTRPITPYITQAVCRLSLVLIGLDYRVEGHPMQQGGGIVANHCSWIDIFALNSFQRVYFVSKSEVASWPFIGQLAKATGTVFIERNPAKAAEQRELFTMRLQAGHKLLF
ncbi:MAG: lysophospholipid acyltransferase family protein, partial [Paracoccaceae bacterium]